MSCDCQRYELRRQRAEGQGTAAALTLAPHDMTLREMSLGELARRCREETQRFLRGDSRDDAYCLQVFERAIVQRDADAWATIMSQYRGIVVAYVAQHTVSAIVRESDDFWVNRAFQRFWSAVGPGRFSQFPDLAALLKYLKLCVHSVLLDEARARRAASLTAPLDEIPESVPAPTNAERSVVGKLAAEQLWQVVLRALRDEPERVVAYFSFTRDLKPAEIFERHPELYGSVADVYRIKRNIIERLRHSPEVRAFLVA